MKAIVHDVYGPPDVLELREIDTPTPGDDEVLVRVHAAGVDPGVWHLATGLPYMVRLMGLGMRAPKTRVRGLDFAGVVEAVGAGVRAFRPGDEVFGACETVEGGSFAEYTLASPERLARKPANLSFEQAAAVPVSACTALQGLRDLGRIDSGQSVLVIGAGGGVGTFAVQLGKAFHSEVTGVCSRPKLDLVRSLGADHVSRLDARGRRLHRRQPPLRPHPRLRGQTSTVRLASRALPGRHPRHRRRRGGRPLDRRLRSPDPPGAGPVAPGQADDPVAQRAGAPAQTSSSSATSSRRQGHARHRPRLPVGGGPGGAPLPARGPPGRQDRRHRRRSGR